MSSLVLVHPSSIEHGVPIYDYSQKEDPRGLGKWFHLKVLIFQAERFEFRLPSTYVKRQE